MAGSFQTKSYVKSQYILCVGFEMGGREWESLTGDSFLSVSFPHRPVLVSKTILRNYDKHSSETTNLVKYPHVKGEVIEILRDCNFWQNLNLNEDLMNDSSSNTLILMSRNHPSSPNKKWTKRLFFQLPALKRERKWKEMNSIWTTPALHLNSASKSCT